MKKFKVSDTLKDYVANVLTRRAIPFQLKDGYCEVDISGQQFHKIVIRAKMEKLTEEKGSSFPFVASVEQYDTTVLLEVGNDYILM